MERARLAGKVVEKLIRNEVFGSHKKQITTVAKWFPSHQEGMVKDIIEEMARDPTLPIEKYGGGHRSNVRLTSFEEAIEFAGKRGADTMWLEKSRTDY